MAHLTAELAEFVATLRWAELPPAVRSRCEALVRDLAAVCAAGRATPTAELAAAYARDQHSGDEATLLLDGGRVAATGAAFANGVLANALDFDDGHRLVKGHPGAIVIPAALAAAEVADAPADETLAAIVVGYEVAVRAGLELHARSDPFLYHGSGAWGAVGAAAAAARLLGLDRDRLGHALGLAEYHAPLSYVMRSVGEPAMTKDACGLGAKVGVESALLAARGFTALSSLFASTPAATAGLGRTWHVLDVYVKAFPCCRWSQPAVQAALALRRDGAPDPAAIERVLVRTFPAATALAGARPATTEEAQYSVAWPVAVALAHGRFGVEHVLEDALGDPAAAALHDRVELVVDDRCAAAFPGRRLSELTVGLRDGTSASSGLVEAPGEPDDPGWADVVAAKAARHADVPKPFARML